MDLVTFKQANREMWAAGDYDVIAETAKSTSSS